MQKFQSCNVHYNGVDSNYLDCLADNLAVLLYHQGVIDVRTPFACQWHFDFHPKINQGVPSVEKIPILKIIQQQTGHVFEEIEFKIGTYVESCVHYIHNKQPLLVIGDAYFMPWLPYFGREHMKHSFIVDGISDDKKLIHIVDAYSNQTQWGKATPTDTFLPSIALERIVDASNSLDTGLFLRIIQKTKSSPIDWLTLLHENATNILLQVQEQDLLRQFSQFYQEQVNDIKMVQQFVLGCWLVSRARTLHALWLADIGRNFPHLLDEKFGELFMQKVSISWQRVSEFSYIMLRRVSQGRVAPLSCFQIIEQTIYINEIELAEQLITQTI